MSKPTQEITGFCFEVMTCTHARIHYDIAGETVGPYLLDINVEYEPGEPEHDDCPAMPVSAELVKVFGFSVAEKHAFDAWELDNDVEQMIIDVIEGEKALQ